MRIGIDIDDTIANTYEVQFNLAQNYAINELKRDGKIQQLEDLKTHFYIGRLHNWSKEEEINFFKKYYKNCLEDIQPKMFAKEVIEKLKQEGNEIYIVTARFSFQEVDAKVYSEKWLEKYQIPYDALIVDAQEKGKIAQENKIDIFIDDSYSNCEKIAQCGIKTYIMDSRVNRGIENKEIERIYSWPHFYQKVREDKE